MAMQIVSVKYIDFSNLNEYVGWGIGAVKYIITWFLYATFFITLFKDIPVSFKEMMTNKPKLKILLSLLLILAVYDTGSYFYSGGFKKPDMPLYDYIWTVAVVGLFEESVFRGWFLNAISKFSGVWIANLISSLLFVFIHYPGWISKGYSFMQILTSSISVYILGLLFGFAFIKTKSIWTGAILHSLWDMVSFLL